MFAKAKENHDEKTTLDKFDAVVKEIEGEGVSIVRRDNLYGVIDKSGKEIIPLIWKFVRVVKSDVFVVGVDIGYQIYKGSNLATEERFYCLNLALKEAEKY